MHARFQLLPSRSCMGTMLGQYNKMSKYVAWCISFCFQLFLGGVYDYHTILYPNCGSVHKCQPMNNCCHPLQIKAPCPDC